MIKFVTTSIAFLGFAAAATAAVPMLQEEQVARAEEARIITLTIAGIENRLWFDYRINVTEAQVKARAELCGVEVLF